MSVEEQNKKIYLAGGCFWGMEKLMRSIPGVIEAISGYANGSDEENANYKAVCSGQTGFRETVEVEYNPKVVSLDALLLAYFYVIDSTAKNRQGNDIGSQYQAGIYYVDDDSRETVGRIAAIEAGRVDGFAVEIEPLRSFYHGEEYHQRYLDKNPGGYCHIPIDDIELFTHLIIDPGRYRRPAKEVIRKMLDDEQYNVTQEGGTERPFSSPYWNADEKGIYVDIVTGEPLFSSSAKYESSCGWPSFSAPIEETLIAAREDHSHGMSRTEVRSRAGDSHLGHVFQGDSESPNGVRYCINGASLRFIPYTKMEEEGYGYLMDVL